MTDWKQLAREKQAQLDAAAEVERSDQGKRRILEAQADTQWSELQNQIRENLREFNEAMGREFLRVEKVHRDSINIRRNGKAVLGLGFSNTAYTLSVSAETAKYLLEVDGVNKLMWRYGADLYSTLELADRLTKQAIHQA